jgi:hypothetical protein
MAAAFVALCAGAPEAAQALWTSGSAGPGRVTAVIVPQANTPLAVASGHNVTVSWNASQLSGGTPVAGYKVRRYANGGIEQSVGSACSGTITSTSCVEANVPTGTWRYTVTATQSTWLGPESTQGSAITVGNASLTFTSSTAITSLPATLNGTIANFLTAELLTFRLDSTTGTVLTGSPSVAGVAGGATISVTIPAGTNDAPHSVFVVGSLGSVASAAIDVTDPPHLSTLRMYDTNANGKVDSVVAVFDQTLATYNAGVSPWTLANVPSAGTLSSVAVSGATATLTLSEGPGSVNTAAGSFTVALAANSAGIRDIYNHTASFAATAVADLAPPVLTAAPVMLDTNANGKVDSVTASFTETLGAYTAANTPWTLANVPSAGTLASVAVASPAATLTITEGAGAANTAVGSFTIAMAANASGIRDAAGNLASFAATAPSDGAKPLKSSMSFYDDNKNGKVDRVSTVFTEPLAAYTAGTTPWTLASAPSSATANNVVVSGATADLNLTEGTGAATTAVGSFTVAMASNSAGARDAAGNLASFTATAPTDKAAPAYTSLTLTDSNNNGKVDQVTAVFSEPLLTYSAGNTPWTLTNVPSADVDRRRGRQGHGCRFDASCLGVECQRHPRRCGQPDGACRDCAYGRRGPTPDHCHRYERHDRRQDPTGRHTFDHLHRGARPDERAGDDDAHPGRPRRQR